MEDEVLDTQNESPSMDDTIRATLAEINARDAEPEEVETEAEAEPEAPARERDDKGRFAAKQEEPEQTETPAPEVAPVVDEPIPQEVQRLGLRKEELAAWKQADPMLQQALLRRSEEMHRGFEQYKAPAEFGRTMAQAFIPYQQTLDQLGVTPDVAVGKLLQIDNTLRYGNPAQKAQAVANIITQFGVDLNALQNAPQVDPYVYALQDKLSQLEGYITQQQREQQEREQATLNSEIAKFSEGREHFETVREDMAALLQAGRATDLNDAYEKAIWANPSVRAALIAKQQSEAAEKAEKERKAQEAKRASAVNVPRKGKLPATAPKGTMEDTIRAEAARLGLIQS